MALVIRSLAWLLVAVVATAVQADEKLLAKATNQMQTGQLKEASQTVRTVLRQNPKSSQAWALSARIHLRMKETMLAIVEFTKAIEKDSTPSTDLYLARARAWTNLPIEKQKNLKQAIASLDEGLKRIGRRQELLSYLEELRSRLKTLAGEERIPDRIFLRSVRSTQL